MAEPDLTESAWQRAKIDAADIYRTTTFQFGGAMLNTFFSALALIAQEGQPIAIQVAFLAMAAAMGILLPFFVVFVFQLGAAPVRRRQALREERGSTRKEAFDLNRMLLEAYRCGDELALLLEQRLALKQRSEPKDQAEVETWTGVVVAMLAAHAPESAGLQFIATGKGEPNLVARLRLRIDCLHELISELE
jgi:hypothetical protein